MNEIKIEEIKRNMFTEFEHMPILNYHYCVELDAELSQFINYSMNICFPCAELNLNAISEIKEEIKLMLITVCACKNPSTIRFILSKYPDVRNKIVSSNFSPLHSCVSPTDRENRQKIIELLHYAGAKMKIKDDEKNLTALNYTAFRNKPLCAEALLKCDANIDMTEVNSATILHGAAFQGNIEISKVLLEVKANPTTEYNHGNTPISLTSRRDHQKLYNLFEEYSYQ
jgi:hypothetical protein